MNDRVDARIVYWGIAGAGKSTNLRVVYGKLKAGNRGELVEHPTRLDPTVCYEELPIELGDVGGQPTRLQLVTVPSGPENAPTRKQLLDEVAGVVLVVDAQPDRIGENLASVEELKTALASYGRRLADLPVVVQYNKRDLSDPNAIEDLHRQLALPGAAVFEAIASETTGVLKTLTTVSKGVVRVLRNERSGVAAAAAESAIEPAPEATAPAVEATPAPAPELEPEPAPEPMPTAVAAPGSNAWVEDAILLEAEEVTAPGPIPEPDDAPPTDVIPAGEPLDEKPAGGMRLGADLEIVSLGEAERTSARGLRVPVVLGNADGETVTIALRVELDPLLDDSA